MKEKFYRIVSPINLFVMLLLDCGCAYFLYLSVTKLMEARSTINIAFICIMLFIAVVAVLSTVQLLKNGVQFYSDRVEFIGLYSENEFRYEDIEKIEYHKDTKASFRKNFIDRFSNITFYLKDEKVVTVSLGMTTYKVLNTIVNEINSRLI